MSLPSSFFWREWYEVIVTSIFPNLERSGVAISIPFSLLAGKGDEVIVTCLFTNLGTLGRGGVTSGREGKTSWSHVSSIPWEERKRGHGHLYIPSLGKRGSEAMVTSTFSDLERGKVARSCSLASSLIWELW